MKNQLFNQTSEDDRRQKLDSVIRERTNGALTEDQIRALINSIGPEAQHTILMYTDPYEFSEALSSRGSGDFGVVVFGQAEFARSLIRDCYAGILRDPKEPAAAVIIQKFSGRMHYFAHIYLPERSEGSVTDE